jgi:hypothetical protein
MMINTWQTNKKKITGFLGFVSGKLKHTGPLTISLYTNLPFFLEFLNYQEARGVKATNIKAHMETAMMVVRYLASMPSDTPSPGQEATLQYMKRLGDRLGAFKKENKQFQLRERGQSVPEAVPVPPAFTVLKVQDDCIKKVIEEVESLLEVSGVLVSSLQ